MIRDYDQRLYFSPCLKRSLEKPRIADRRRHPVHFCRYIGHRFPTTLLSGSRSVSGLDRTGERCHRLNCLATSVAVITFIFAIFLIVEGVFLSVTAFTMRATPGWVWMLISGIASLFLGVIVYNHWPSDSTAILGLFFGINLLFNGSSLLALGLSARKPTAA